jgi:UDP-glucuronate decarboxylase
MTSPFMAMGFKQAPSAFIDDNVDACLGAFYNDLFVNDVVNIGGDVEITILQLAETVIEATGSQSKLVHLPALEEGDMTRRLPDISKMRDLLKRAPKTLLDGLKIVIEKGQFISLL